MLLTIAQKGPGADEISWLLHKHPDKAQAFNQSFGKAHVFYPHAEPEHTEVAMLLEVDTVELVRGKNNFNVAGHPLAQYVNDRPYVASSLLCVALNDVMGTALAGNCADKPEAVDVQRPLTATLSAVPCDGGVALLKRIFEPLGYTVEAHRVPLDPEFPEWGDSPYHRLKISGTVTLQALLTHLYVLIPVLDNDKHYWVGAQEVDKLLRKGGDWLTAHPEKDLITKRYLKHRNRLVSEAMQRMIEDKDPDLAAEEAEAEEEAIEQPIRLNTQRLDTVAAALKASGARTVIDFGCGSAKLIRQLVSDPQFTHLRGIDVSMRSLKIGADMLSRMQLNPEEAGKISLVPGSALYRDENLNGFDAGVLMEVIEHLEPNRLKTLEKSIFHYAKPKTLIVTTPNAEYNVLFETMPAGTFRHRDHRFEWTRQQFEAWATEVAEARNYSVRFEGIGPVHENHGAPTQMAIFKQIVKS